MNTLMHPDDLAYKAKVFINELGNVQQEYFDRLVVDLKIDNQGEEWLFDYVFNESLKETFTEYLEVRGKSLDGYKIS